MWPSRENLVLFSVLDDKCASVYQQKTKTLSIISLFPFPVCVCVGRGGFVCPALVCTIHDPVILHTLRFKFIKDNLCTEELVTAGPALCPHPAHWLVEWFAACNQMLCDKL